LPANDVQLDQGTCPDTAHRSATGRKAILGRLPKGTAKGDDARFASWRPKVAKERTEETGGLKNVEKIAPVGIEPTTSRL
jgi:hypothetical protein